MNSDDFSLLDFMDAPEDDLFAKAEHFAEYARDYRQKGYYTYFRQNLGMCGPRVTIQDMYSTEPREMIMMASNNYLGLAQHPEVIEAGQAALRQYGTGSNGSPVLCGHTDLHHQLEEQLAQFKSCEDAIIYPTGFAANYGTINALVRQDDLLVVDRLDHASIIDGSTASGARLCSFHHNDSHSLDQILSRYAPHSKGILVIVEGIYSMDGDIADLPGILAVCRKHHARLMVDEAHATGVVGQSGKGSIEHHGLEGQIDLVMGTFSKALGVNGGFVAGSHAVIDYLRFYSRSYFFSTALAPVMAACALKALQLIQEGRSDCGQLWENIYYMTRQLKALGFRTVEGHSAIIPIIIGDDTLLRKMAADIHRRGIFLNSVFYPAVPRDSSRIRLSLMATHSREDLDRTLEALEQAGRQFGLI